MGDLIPAAALCPADDGIAPRDARKVYGI